MAPSCFLVLSAPSVMAFLDILPMTRGHLLVTVRGHREKVHDLGGGEGAEIGMFCLLAFGDGGGGWGEIRMMDFANGIDTQDFGYLFLRKL